MSLLPFERCCLFHKESLLRNRSFTPSQTTIDLYETPKGSPRQEEDNFPTLHPISKAKSSRLSTSPTRMISLFSKLIFNANMVSNHMSSQYKKVTCFLEASQTLVSSTKRRWEISSPPPPLPPTLNLKIKPSSRASKSNLLRTSEAITNKKREIGSLCLNLL